MGQECPVFRLCDGVAMTPVAYALGWFAEQLRQLSIASGYLRRLIDQQIQFFRSVHR